jgi:hypothetical protein
MGGPIAGGRQAFSYQPVGTANQLVSQQVARVQSDTGLARAWTLSLNAWQGNLFTPGVPKATTRVRLTLTGGGEAGGGAATEVVEVDYPRAGTTFNVHAVTVTVEVKLQMPSVVPGPGMPVYSGWIGVGTAQNGTDMDATLTEAIRVVADGNGFQENIPARARAFRVLFLSVVHVLNLLQNDMASTGCVNTGLQMIPEIGHTLEASLSRWMPLHPDAVFLVASNQDGLGAVGQWSIQWLLELG